MNRNRPRRGFSLIELLIVIAIILIIVTVALPKLNKARMYAQETAALKAMQTLNTAQVQYNSTFGRFATSLAELGPPASGTANASAADLISSDLASGEKQGYRFTMQGTPGGYAITGVPVVFGSTGSRTFFTDQSLVLRENFGQEPATANSPEVGSAAANKGGGHTK
jgi:type IV pilus assembly protein PilA